MDCLHPLRIPNPKWNPHENISANKYLYVPCGRCEACVVNTANEWRTRLQLEYESSDSGYFVTLTYADTSLPFKTCSDSFGDSHLVCPVSKRDVQLFLKRVRKAFKGCTVRYYAVSEYCPTSLRPHYHLLLFNLVLGYGNREKERIEVTKVLERCWSNGFVTVDDVTSGRISYVTKYLTCTQDLPEYYPKPFRLMSRNPGIGSSYLNRRSLVEWHRKYLINYFPDGEFKKRLPRYLLTKIFDDDMLSQISEESQRLRKEKFWRDVENAYYGGYIDLQDFRRDMTERFLRMYEHKLKKSRKDL